MNLFRARRGFTLVEVMVVLTMIGILTAICAWTFPRAVEQSRADLAAANLRTIWAAQRFYRLKNGVYAGSIDLLRQEDLIDSAVLSPSDPADDDRPVSAELSVRYHVVRPKHLRRLGRFAIPA